MVRYVRDVMSRVMTCTPDITVREAARRMTQRSVDALIVVHPITGELEGVITRSDLVRAYGKDLDAITVEAVMSMEVETIVPDIPVAAAVLIMLDRKLDRLVIMHAKPATPRPVGVLSMADVVQDMAGSDTG